MKFLLKVFPVLAVLAFIVLGSFVSLKALAAPIDPAVVAQWEAKMIAEADYWRPRVLASDRANNVTSNGGNCYYDGASVYRQVSEYTGRDYMDASDRCAGDYAESRRPNGGGGGQNKFPEGLAAYILEDGGPLVTVNDVSLISRTGWGSFIGLDVGGSYIGDYCGTCTNVIRELAYSISAETEAERVGLPRIEGKLVTYVGWMESILWQMRSGEYIDNGRGAANESQWQFRQPFMVGLAHKELIGLLQWEEENGRSFAAMWPTTHWPTLEAAIADHMIDLMDVAVVKNGQCQTPQAGQRMWNGTYFAYVDHGINGETYPGCVIRYEEDLNLLIAPALAWACMRTGNADLGRRHDEIFGPGINFGRGQHGKQFNQAYWFSIMGLSYRNSEACSGGVVIEPNDPPVVTAVMGELTNGKAMILGGANLAGAKLEICTGNVCAEIQNSFGNDQSIWFSAPQEIQVTAPDGQKTRYSLNDTLPWQAN